MALQGKPIGGAFGGELMKQYQSHERVDPSSMPY